MEFLIKILLILISGSTLVVLLLCLYIVNQGNAKFELLKNQRSQFNLVSLTKESANFEVSIPFVNSGSQDGTITDFFPRHLLPEEQFDKVKVETFLARTTAERSDGYWEAIIIPKKSGETIKLTVVFTAKDGDILAALKEMVDMPISFVCHIVSRGDWYLQKYDIVMPRKEIAQELNKLSRALKEAT
jgi:hypothetical protein